MNKLSSMHVKLTNEIMDIFLLGQKYVLRSSYHLNTQIIMEVTQVLYSKLMRKNRDKVLKDRCRTTSKYDVVNIEKKNHSGRIMVMDEHGCVTWRANETMR